MTDGSNFKVYAVRPILNEVPLVIVTSLPEAFGLVSEYFICLKNKEESYFSSRLIFDEYPYSGKTVDVDRSFMLEQALFAPIQPTRCCLLMSLIPTSSVLIGITTVCRIFWKRQRLGWIGW